MDNQFQKPKLLTNLDGTIQQLWDKGEISLNLKHYLEMEVQKKATKLLEELESKDLESLSADEIADIVYTNIGDFDARWNQLII